MPEWHLTTEHAASSYDIPVLVDPKGTAYGPGDLLSVAQAAQALGVSKQRALQLIGTGRLKAQLVGSAYVIRVADLLPVWERRPGRPAKSPSP